MKYLQQFWESFAGMWSWFVQELARPAWDNYYYWFIAVSLLFFLLENLKPWREKQSVIRKDFWLDAFYMVFNIMLFSLIGYKAASDVFAQLFNDFLQWSFGIQNLLMFKLNELPFWAYMLTMFVISDFLSYWVHRLLHRVPWLWEFHKVHHSVEQMGFAAHLRYHWMENVVYKSLKYIPLTMIGFGLQDLFILYVFELAWGHFNHANFTIPLGPLKYIFNNPKMHIWHHAKELPDGSYGINYGLTLSVWDYIFGSAHIPYDGKEIELGFEGIEDFPEDFVKQQLSGFTKK